MIGIYKIVNTLNNKVYVGSSCNINNRWNQHKKSLSNNTHHSLKLQRTYNKYGDIFIYELITECKIEDLLTEEQYYIELLNSYKNGYNSVSIAGSNLGMKHTIETKNKLKESSIGNTNRIGKKHTEESKLKISIKLKGKVLSDETKLRMSESQMGKKMSTESVEKTKIANTGKKRTDETKSKMSKSKLGKKQSIEVIENRVKLNTGKKRTDESKKKISIKLTGIKRGLMSDDHKLKIARFKKIALISNDGSIIKEYKSIKDCSIELEIDHRRISDVLNGKKESHKGYKFIYI